MSTNKKYITMGCFHVKIVIIAIHYFDMFSLWHFYFLVSYVKLIKAAFEFWYLAHCFTIVNKILSHLSNISWVRVAFLFSFLHCPIMCLYVLNSVLWGTLQFPHNNDVRFVFATGVCRRVHDLFMLFVFACS